MAIVRVPVTNAELLTCFNTATARQEVKEVHDVKTNHRIALDKSDLEVHLLGYLGEFVWSKYLGCPLDGEARIGGDDGICDISLPGGYSLQVKTALRHAPHLNPDLAFNDHSDFKSNCAALAVIDDGTLIYAFSLPPEQAIALIRQMPTVLVELAGWIDRSSFQAGFVPKKLVEVRHVWQYRRLREPASLLAKVESLRVFGNYA